MKKRILVVEDEAALRLAYEEELKAEGYDVSTARNGKEALSLLKKKRPNLIILDIIMPEMGGMEALIRILSEERDIPIILHTSYPEYKRDLMSWGADAYIMKSDDLNELKEKIRELLEKRREPKPAQEQ